MARALETVEDARRRAERRLPRQVYDALWAGSQAGVTLRENTRAFERILVRTRVGDLPTRPSIATTVMGLDLSMPVFISPVGAQGIMPDAEVEVARAAAGAGTAMSLSSFATVPIEDVTAVNDKTLFQIFWVGGRDAIGPRIERARAAGAAGMIVTMDWTFQYGRDWGSPYIPADTSLKSIAPYIPQALLHPSWLAAFLRAGSIPKLVVPNVFTEDRPTPGFFEAYGEWMQTDQPSWDDIAWVKQVWGGPMMVKGILSPEDARRARDVGADAISVSNHGGNDMDGVVPSIAALPGVVEAVGGDVEIVLDSGIRRGSDAVKAIALGAKAVMIGRAYLWALAARGRQGVSEILEVFRSGVQQTLVALGVDDLGRVGPEHVIVPEHFYDSHDQAAF